MKGRNLRDATPPRPDLQQQQQLDPITSLPKPQRFGATQLSGSRSQQGPRVGVREPASEFGQAPEKRYVQVTRSELSHYGERFLPPLQPAPSQSSQGGSSQKPSHYQREMSTLE